MRRRGRRSRWQERACARAPPAVQGLDRPPERRRTGRRSRAKHQVADPIGHRRKYYHSRTRRRRSAFRPAVESLSFAGRRVMLRLPRSYQAAMRPSSISAARGFAGRRSSPYWPLLCATAACGGKAAGPPAPQPVATLTMQPRPTSLTQEYPAQLEASNTVEIRPQVSGILFRQAGARGHAGEARRIAVRDRSATLRRRTRPGAGGACAGACGRSAGDT